MNTKDDFVRWFEDGKKKGATHAIIVCDTFDHTDFPIYVMPGENCREKAESEGKKPMQRVMEVYSLSLDFETQFKEVRAFHYD
ncbi:MAG: hypothetical protein UW41_C0010G0019 [Candidatus Collierbacteria bacterium GW2011_GWC2_44_18]|uniref:Uncharacterized protein n=2 Tax=Microgenomates group TaxID=1794810 RepID=A0A0G1M610_9BACT|nr:MAG: hypothetical protein UW16_C0032G0005 [Microgenomates group bacterium GW2011_GWC1_44_10]KKT49180.1 MAG: hypothetical protein UW41_C0010G0019 [Candidatus Collierbacteria bacterium GW2011_GWC2_44_18]KKT67349.1 MAG: hypothetical protein UW60_C0008G0011 [Candidatus Woesebacteria bacterium GW2011_GWA2_44_33]